MVESRKLMLPAGVARIAPVLLTLVIFIAVWEGAIALFDIPPFVLPHVADVAGRFVTDAGALSDALAATLAESIGGFALGVIAGVAIAVLMTFAPFIERMLLPVLVAINSVPIVGYVPLTLAWFGIGATSKVALVVLATGFVVLINTLHGLKQADAGAIDLLRSFGASRIAILYRLQMPVALPSLVTAIRVAIPRSMIVAIVAEMLGAYQGVGRIIFESTQQMDYLAVWAAVLSASLASVVLYGVAVWLDKRLVWWQ
ncbi:ABC nitrate/sulfonate/bicarbonate transporter, inner membrane subunit [Caballeronia hypogeia]|uniref:ABC nitrate/sulfonate/bicarbonate transporter, inner membrane subunit n=1 Tax=Caballeronia hypogeia TaxID=1777140 RepID=A0A158DHC9_9BURK|nr:ABC transporter permease [Caballeronia hypogeia]SAK93968.1 ABC nitrate/sulfonate/bicarbonate transporter, inner membrane subunit [Caballeronia hypogeia]